MSRTLNPTMTEEDNWDCPIKVSKYLGSLLEKGRITIFLGAGISKHFGFPDWDTLIQRMLQKTKVSLPPNVNSAEDKAEHIFNEKFCDDEAGYHRLIRECLYEDVEYSFQAMRSHNALAAISSLAMSSARGSVSKIITTNFDDALEIYLRYHGFCVNSIPDSTHWQGSTDIAVYHPHGLMPFSNDKEVFGNIIFDRYSFSKIIGNQMDPWNRVVSGILKTHFCLFIGVSGDDQNLDSFCTNINSEEHPAKKENGLYWGVNFSNSSIQSSKWRRRGVKNFVVDNFDEGLSTFLFNICQKAAEKRFPNK